MIMEFNFGWEYLKPLNFILTLVFITIIYGIGFFTFAKVMRRKSGYIFLAISYVLMICTVIFNLWFVAIACGSVTAAGIAICLFANLGDLRNYLAAPFRKATAKAANFGVEKIFDRAQLYKDVETAVLALSKTRTGVLITFERNTSLKDIMKNGVPVHAPLSPELLQTIFYEGTRLHDGAVVVHGNEIVAASVFFTPTTKPFAGKYGSRHRAAIGVSEVSDSVTVVVSEETGRISFAVNGQLETVDPTNFLRAFTTYMSDTSSNEE